MSLWKWNDVELEVDFEDVEFCKRYESVFDKLEKDEQEVKETEKRSEFLEKYCNMYWELFDKLFGSGTAEKLFDKKKHIGQCECCFDSFISFCTKQVNESNKKRMTKISKYKVIKK